MGDDLFDFLQEIHDDVSVGIDLLKEQAEIDEKKENVLIKPRDSIFEKNPLIRTKVFDTEEEAAMADMSTPGGVQYMKAMALFRGLLGE